MADPSAAQPGPNQERLKPEPVVRILLAAAGVIATAIAIGLLLTSRQTSSVTETTNQIGTTTNKVTNTVSSGSDTLALGLFGTGALLVIIGAFFDRIKSLTVKVAGSELTAQVGRTYDTTGGGQLTLPSAFVSTAQGEKATLDLDPVLLFTGTDQQLAAGTVKITYDMATDRVHKDLVTIPNPGQLVQWRNVEIGTTGGEQKKTFEDLAFKVDVKGEPRRALFLPVDDGSTWLQGIVLFVPPAPSAFEWSIDYTWSGLWQKFRVEGTDEGEMTMRKGVTHCTLCFVFPLGTSEARLEVTRPEGLLPDTTASVEAGRPVITWRLPPPQATASYAYVVSGRSALAPPEPPPQAESPKPPPVPKAPA